MAEKRCKTCPMRAYYDRKPKSIIGRIWRWHINWCPGWKSYMKSLTPEEKAEVAARYGLKV